MIRNDFERVISDEKEGGIGLYLGRLIVWFCVGFHFSCALFIIYRGCRPVSDQAHKNDIKYNLGKFKNWAFKVTGRVVLTAGP